MGMTIAQKILKAHLVDGEMVLGQEIGRKNRPDADAGCHRHDGLSPVRGDGRRSGQDRALASLTLTTIPCSPASRMRTTTDLSVLSLRSTASTIRQAGQRHLSSGTSGALRRTGQDPDRLGQPYADRRRHRHAGRSVPAVWTLQSQWAAARTTSPMPKMVRVNLVGKLSPWVSAKDVILDVLRQTDRQGRCRQDRRVRRRGRKDPVRTGACHHHQYGR